MSYTGHNKDERTNWTSLISTEYYLQNIITGGYSMFIFICAPFVSCTKTTTALHGFIHFLHVPTTITPRTFVLTEKKRDILPSRTILGSVSTGDGNEDARKQ